MLHDIKPALLSYFFHVPPFCKKIIMKHFSTNYPVGNYMLKVNNRNPRTISEICSKLTIKTSERRSRSSVAFSQTSAERAEAYFDPSQTTYLEFFCENTKGRCLFLQKFHLACMTEFHIQSYLQGFIQHAP